MVAASVAVAISASFVIVSVFIICVRLWSRPRVGRGRVASGYRPRCYRSQHQDKPTEAHLKRLRQEVGRDLVAWHSLMFLARLTTMRPGGV